MTDTTDRILQQLETRGFRGRVVSVSRIQELETEMGRLHGEGLFDEDFYRVWLRGFDFKAPQSLPHAESVIVAAVPHPQFRVTFHVDQQSVSTVIPPTYLHYSDSTVRRTLEEVLDNEGFHLARARVPAKLLLARCGLGKYGRNNLSYIEGMGSYFRLGAFYTDLPCDGDTWQEPQMLDECSKCTACVRACPTGALAEDRFLLHAEKCIPFFNERQVGFPEWMDPSWHNSLIGCMICQNACPVDKPFRDWFEDTAEFTEEETKLILDGVSFDSHSLDTQQKLAAMEWTEDLDMLARNLRLLLDARTGIAR